jgi:hypothetical protein
MRPAWAVLADRLVGVIELFYRVRFGGRPLTEPERQNRSRVIYSLLNSKANRRDSSYSFG